MLNAIKNFFEENITSNTSVDIDHQLRLATAALLIEIMQQDHSVKDDERQAVKKVLQEKFDLSDAEAKELFDLARLEASEATDNFQFTSLIAREYSMEEKIRVIEYLWKIAWSDSHLDPLEEHMIRRIADLIYVPHREFIQAKLRVEKEIRKQ